MTWALSEGETERATADEAKVMVEKMAGSRVEADMMAVSAKKGHSE